MIQVSCSSIDYTGDVLTDTPTQNTESRVVPTEPDNIWNRPTSDSREDTSINLSGCLGFIMDPPLTKS